MIKELTPLEAFYDLLSPIGLKEEGVKRYYLIETALKNYEELTSKPAILYERTHERSQALIDTICKNYKEIKITNLEDEEKVKAFDIIKKKEVAVFFLNKSKDVNDYNHTLKTYGTNQELSQDEYDLLKEVLL